MPKMLRLFLSQARNNRERPDPDQAAAIGETCAELTGLSERLARVTAGAARAVDWKMCVPLGG